MIKPGYWQCPCENCQEGLGEGGGPRKACRHVHQFDARTGKITHTPKEQD